MGYFGMANATRPVVTYVATVLAVIGTATMAAFSLNAMTAKAHRSWDADIDRIIAQQQEKKRLMEMAAVERMESRVVFTKSQPAIAADVISGPLDEDDELFETRESSEPQKAQSQNTPAPSGKKSAKRAAKRKQYVPAAFVTFPRFAVVTTSTILRLR
jgi:hypothetical protein